jgi:hypothetical protein
MCRFFSRVYLVSLSSTVGLILALGFAEIILGQDETAPSSWVLPKYDSILPGNAINWPKVIHAIVTDDGNEAELTVEQRQNLLICYQQELEVLQARRLEIDKQLYVFDDSGRTTIPKQIPINVHAALDNQREELLSEMSLSFSKRLPEILTPRQLGIVKRNAIGMIVEGQDIKEGLASVVSRLSFDSEKEKNAYIEKLWEIEIDRRKKLREACEKAWKALMADLPGDVRDEIEKRLDITSKDNK